MDFEKLIGLYSWGWSIVYDQILSIEFGEAHLNIREPVKSVSPSEKITRAMARRKITPVGQWNITFEAGFWVASSFFSSTSSEQIEGADARETLKDMDGQVLSRVGIEENFLRLHFDLGGTLEVPRKADRATCEIYFNNCHVTSFF